MKKLLLFDIDGTLLSTHGAGMRAMHRAGVEIFGDSFSFDGVSAAGGLDPLLLADAAHRSGVKLADHHHQTFRETYCRLLPAELEASTANLRVMPGVVAILQELRGDPRVTLGVLTGNYGVTARMKLRVGGIDPEWFAVTAFGDEGTDRPSLVMLAMDRFERLEGHRVEHRNVVVIGDTPKDVHAAATHGCRSLAVATGPYSVEQLREAGADVAVADLADPGPLWEMIRR